MKYCNFCGRPENVVPLLMTGNGACICSDCVNLAKGYMKAQEETNKPVFKEIPKPKDFWAY